MASPGDRLRLLLGTGVGSVLASYLLTVVLAAVAGLTAGAEPALGSLLAVAVPLWLAVHQVPLLVDGAPLGVLPLLPTAALMGFVASSAARVTRRLGGRVREDASAAVATLGGAHASVAILATALPASPAPATPWDALLGGGLVTAVGASVGAFRVAGPPPWWLSAPEWLRRGLLAASIGMAALLSAGALMLLAALLDGVAEVNTRLQEVAPDLGASLGMTLLCLFYLPNAVIASVSWLAGPGLSIGSAAASPLSVTAGPLPPVPLMAAMPVTEPPRWTVIAFVLPVLAGVLVGYRCRSADPEPARRLAAALVASGAVAVSFGVLAGLASGQLATGPFNPVELPALAVGAALFAWILVPAAAVVLLADQVWLAQGPTRMATLAGVRQARFTGKWRKPGLGRRSSSGGPTSGESTAGPAGSAGSIEAAERPDSGSAG